ncbi:hypothetical protein [Aquirufa sp.]|jgi:hypothetical protein|uniref:hypothetical protein n=1 Tax=Aquirufa sp. TaxID=2676249 RepID=UPI0037BED0F6
MFFFFGKEAEFFSKIQSDFCEWKLRKVKDLFQVSSGLIQSRYNDREAESNLPVRFLNLGAFDYEKNRIRNEDEMIKLNRIKQANSSDNNQNKIDIPNDKVLIPSDYIINMRGEPKGFSMVDILNIVPDQKYVLANQFFVLRPNKDIPYSIPYLHKLLDLVVIPELQRVYLSKKDEIKVLVDKNKEKNQAAAKSNKSTKASEKISFNSFAMSDLSEINLNVIVNIADQEKIIEKFNEFKVLKLEAVKNEIEFNESFQQFSLVNSTKL